MHWTYFLLIPLIIGFGIIGFLIYKKLPQLRIVDPKTAPEVKSRELKNELIRQRLSRASSKHTGALQKRVLTPLFTFIQTNFRRLAGKLTAAERRYQEKKRKDIGGKLDTETVKGLMSEAKRLAEEELWERAEKKYIEIISSDPKYAPAYEYLGRLYLAKKDFPLAKETFEFLAKISPKDASVTASLGEVAEEMKLLPEALDYYKKAVKLSPKNPKYLDFLISSAIELKDRKEAQSALLQLKRVNPENRKIEQFEAEIDELPKLTKKKET